MLLAVELEDGKEVICSHSGRMHKRDVILVITRSASGKFRFRVVDVRSGKVFDLALPTKQAPCIVKSCEIPSVKQSFIAIGTEKGKVHLTNIPDLWSNSNESLIDLEYKDLEVNLGKSKIHTMDLYGGLLQDDAVYIVAISGTLNGHISLVQLDLLPSGYVLKHVHIDGLSDEQVDDVRIIDERRGLFALAQRDDTTCMNVRFMALDPVMSQINQLGDSLQLYSDYEAKDYRWRWSAANGIYVSCQHATDANLAMYSQSIVKCMGWHIDKDGAVSEAFLPVERPVPGSDPFDAISFRHPVILMKFGPKRILKMPLAIGSHRRTKSREMLWSKWFEAYEFPYTHELCFQLIQNRQLYNGNLFFDRLANVCQPVAATLYPPTSKDMFRQLVDTLQSSVGAQLPRDCVLYYLLRDVDADAASEFAEASCIPERYRIAVEGYSAFDRGDTTHGIRLLSYPSVDLDWYEDVLQCLSANERWSDLILFFESVPPANPLSQGLLGDLMQAYMMTDARGSLQFIKAHGKSSMQLYDIFFNYVFRGQNTKVLDDLLLLPLSKEDERRLVAYCCTHGNVLSKLFLVIYLLQRERFVDAVEAYGKLNLQSTPPTTQLERHVYEKIVAEIPRIGGLILTSKDSTKQRPTLDFNNIDSVYDGQEMDVEVVQPKSLQKKTVPNTPKSIEKLEAESNNLVEEWMERRVPSASSLLFSVESELLSQVIDGTAGEESVQSQIMDSPHVDEMEPSDVPTIPEDHHDDATPFVSMSESEQQTAVSMSESEQPSLRRSGRSRRRAEVYDPGQEEVKAPGAFPDEHPVTSKPIAPRKKASKVKSATSKSNKMDPTAAKEPRKATRAATRTESAMSMETESDAPPTQKSATSTRRATTRTRAKAPTTLQPSTSTIETRTLRSGKTIPIPTVPGAMP